MKTIETRDGRELEQPACWVIDCNCDACAEYGEELEHYEAERALEKAEHKYRSAVANLRGRFEAILKTGSMPVPDAAQIWLCESFQIDELWLEHQRALRAYHEIG